MELKESSVSRGKLRMNGNPRWRLAFGLGKTRREGNLATEPTAAAGRPCPSICTGLDTEQM